MSVANGITQQSARLYFKQKDHKDLYGTLPYGAGGQFTGFHHGLYMQGKDTSRYDIIWRKMYPDKYFLAITEGYSWTDVRGSRGIICYPEQKVCNINYQGAPYIDVLADVGKHILYVPTGDNTFTMIGSEDGKFINRCGTLLPNVEHARIVGSAKGGFVCKDLWNDRNMWYFPIVEDSHHVLADVGEAIELGSGASMSNNFNYCGLLPYIYFWSARDISPRPGAMSERHMYYKVFNTETQSFSSTQDVNLGDSSGWDYNGVYDKDIFTYTINERDEHNYYVGQRLGFVIMSNGVVSQRVTIPTLRYGFSGVNIKYTNGLYYIYVSGTTYAEQSQNRHNFNILYTTSDFHSFSVHTLPNTVTIYDIKGNSPYTLYMNTDAPYPQGDYDVNFSVNDRMHQLFFENNKLIYPQDRVFRVSIPSGWTNSIIMYFDNPYFQDNGNNFYILSSAWQSDYGFGEIGQEMAKRYYHMNGGS